MKVSFRIGGRPSAELASKTPEEALRNNLQLAKWELDNAYAGFEYATDPDLIDCYIFQLNAAMKRYRYLLNQWNGLDKSLQETCNLAHKILPDRIFHTIQKWKTGANKRASFPMRFL